MDRFWSSRCLNDRIDLPDKIASFSSGAITPMVVKNGTKKLFTSKNKYNQWTDFGVKQGAEGPPQGLKGPLQCPKGLPALRRSEKFGWP